MKKKFKQLYKSFRFNLSANNSFIYKFYYKKFYKPKPNTLSALIDEISKTNKTNFTVIQVGANDGINNDPIHKFIKRDNWRGVLLEPQNFAFEQLKLVYHKDKNIIPVKVALDETDGKKILYKIAFTNARWASGLSSFNKNVLLESFENGYVQQKSLKDKITVPKDENLWIKEENIDTISPKTIIEKYKIKHIDMLMIDTEGFDYEVIKIFFNSISIKPKLIVFENFHLSQTDNLECNNFLISQNYKIEVYKGNTAAILN